MTNYPTGVALLRDLVLANVDVVEACRRIDAYEQAIERAARLAELHGRRFDGVEFTVREARK